VTAHAARGALEAFGIPAEHVFIGGEWMTGDGAIEVVDPYDEQVIGSVPEADAVLTGQAFAAAEDAFLAWSRTTPAERSNLLEALAFAMERWADPLATLASCEIGMPRRDALAGQVHLPVAVARSYARLGTSMEWERRDESGTVIGLVPSGPVLAITPWNFPVHQIIAKLAPAVIAGCPVVLKPSEQTPFNAFAIARLCEEVGFPPGVVNVVTGTGPIAGEALLADERWEVVSFTGSLAVGRRIGAVAGSRVARATLELGGKSPALLLPGADLESAVTATVRNCFVNAGQKCNAPTRMFVPEADRDRLAAVAASVAADYVAGDPLDVATTLGPLVSAVQRDRVRGFIERAESDGAQVLRAGVRLPDHGFFVAPVVVTGVADDAEVAREEVFGPVLTVLGYADENEAIDRANASQYGLSAEVWAGSDVKAAEVARRLCAGQVRVNGQRTPMPPISPFGGFRRSGLGRELGRAGLDEYLESRAILGDPVVAQSVSESFDREV
jgi:acyl-CoA reductase-like NAD-dependent aldehyde dehydrogenase